MCQTLRDSTRREGPRGGPQLLPRGAAPLSLLPDALGTRLEVQQLRDGTEEPLSNVK